MDTPGEWTEHSEAVLDLKGLLCPLPVFKTRKILAAMKRGDVLTVIASDVMSAIDIPHFCAEQGHELLYQAQSHDGLLFRIRRG